MSLLIVMLIRSSRAVISIRIRHSIVITVPHAIVSAVAGVA